jgi:hypothetical protein
MNWDKLWTESTMAHTEAMLSSTPVSSSARELLHDGHMIVPPYMGFCCLLILTLIDAASV